MRGLIYLRQRVIDAIAAADKPSRVFQKRWRRDEQAANGGADCAYCGRTLDLTRPRSAVIDYLIPLHLDGVETDGNRLLACLSCERSKGNKDLVSWKSWTPASEDQRSSLLALRLEILPKCGNHLTRTRAGAPLSAVRRHLEKRFKSSRFLIHVAHGEQTSWIGWTTRSGDKETLGFAAGVLRFRFEASPVGSEQVSLFELPSSHLLNAVWTLIEHHAIAKSVSVDQLDTVPLDEGNWQHHWPKLFRHVGDLARRRERMTGNNPWTPGTPANAKMRFFKYGVVPDRSLLIEPELPPTAPSPPRKFSDAPRSVARRAARTMETTQALRQEFLQARATLDRFKEDVQAGLLEAPSAEELELMELEVLRLCELWELHRIGSQGTRRAGGA